MDLPDEVLMLNVGKGDTRAFEEIVSRYKNKLMSFFFYCTNNYAQAEDLSQEVFIRLFKSAPCYQPRAKFSTFLYTIVQNEWRREQSKTRRCPWMQSLHTPIPAKDGSHSELMERLGSNSSNPGENLERKEMREEIEQAVAKLPEKLKIVFILSQYQDLKYQEIARIIRCPVGTVKSRMSKAVELLRRELAPLRNSEVEL